jgi:predicted dehydrogenase
VDASLSAVLDFGEGLSGTFACSFVSAREQHFTARGSEGVVRLALPFSAKNRPAAIDVNGVEQVFEPCDPAQRMVAHFGRAIRGEEPLRWPLTDSLAQARAMDLLLASVARN